ncbi:nucleotide sugar dehydrogenase [Aeromicrobium fastidiosum]|uniref:UDP-glucose 6-dehydrogenase n=1 Tax=Aeromicrobium fastidiosum TaxID=52699 RepID=A0A641AUE7_9ACTN|nr:nucleotide sugar dehydrogenase [Aeromicrobium fastidiosum]KAA1380478.1 nucleotide sugar dehydrogenase [Aeromicrobium fastidiosum]MBP2390063.1 GDP-mannose 6-dehydrogenase [Aeromicrobium fastidiosum]
MKIAVVGMGYVGVTAAACLASQGHVVCGVDVNEQKVETLKKGLSPISEPGIQELITTAVESGQLTAATTMPDLSEFDIAMVCVGTPSTADGSHNMSYVADSARQIAQALRGDRSSPLTITFRSTFRPGTMDGLVTSIFRSVLGEDMESRVELVYNPEFLRESTAIWDFHHPPKVVIGTLNNQRSQRMVDLHEGIEAPIFELPFRESEMTKFVDNTWHATKVAFANEIGRICAQNEVSAKSIHEVFVADTKLNISAYYLRPGGPFGGSCLPKDVRALDHIASLSDTSVPLISALMPSNKSHKEFQLSRVKAELRKGSTVLMLGLSFKAGTDDLRESPHLDLAMGLVEAGYQLSIYDPELDPAKLVGQNFGYAFARLPEIPTLLVDKSTAEDLEYDLVVRCTAAGDGLNLSGKAIVSLDTIP